MIYVILGMHKSGTTLVSQMLHHSGINMGEDFHTNISYSQGNKYERESTWRLNEDILDCRGVNSIDVSPPDNLQLTDGQRTRMREIIRDCNINYSNWGFKDPRTCLVYPLWASELPEHKIIAIYRSPNELWLRYRFEHYYNRIRNPYIAWKFLNRWIEYNVNVLEHLQNNSHDFVLLEYRRLMTNQKEFDRLQEFVGIPLDDCRRQDLYRNRSDTTPTLLKPVSWLVNKQTGYHPHHVFEQLEALRAAKSQVVYGY